MSAGELGFDFEAREAEFAIADPVMELMLQIGDRLSMLREQRVAARDFEVHTLPGNDDRTEVLLIDRYHPQYGVYARVVSAVRRFDEAGEKIESFDRHIAPGAGRFWFSQGSTLIRPQANSWPIGLKSAPILKLKDQVVDMVAGPRYDAYPRMKRVADDPASIQRLATTLQLLQGLGEVSYEPTYELGQGDF